MQPANKTPTVGLVRALPLFQPLEEDPLRRIAQASRVQRLKRGTIIIERGAHLDGFYAVLEGQLKIYLLACNGSERVIRLLTPGDCFGEAIMFNDFPSPVFVQTLSETQVCFFPKEHVYQALAAQPKFTFAMLRNLSHMLGELVSDLEACCMQNARQRLAHYLLCNATENAAQVRTVDLPASKVVVASTLNLSAETFSRELHQMAHEGLIEVQRRSITLRDPQGLKAVAEQGRPAPARP